MVTQADEYPKLTDALKLFYVFDPCEPNYDYNPTIAEFWGVVSSFAFLLIPLMARDAPPRTARCYYSLILVGICSSIHHMFLTNVSQFFDELSIITAELIFLNAMRIELSPKILKVLTICIVLGLFHPLPLGTAVFYLIIVIIINAVTIGKQHEQYLRGLVMFVAAASLASIVLCFSDILFCPIVARWYLHPGWHIAMAIFCYFGGVCISRIEKIELAKGIELVPKQKMDHFNPFLPVCKVV